MIEAPKHFIQIPVNIASRKDLTPVDKLVYGEIHTMLNVTNKFYMSNTGIAKRIAKSKSTVRHSISHLHKLHLVNIKINTNCQNNSKRFIYDSSGVSKYRHTARPNIDTPYGKIQTGGMSKYRHQIDHTNKLVNRSLSSKKKLASKIAKDLEVLMVQINGFVLEDINNMIKSYPSKLIFKAIHIVATRNPNPKYVINDVWTQLRNGCQVSHYQPKKYSNSKYHPIKEAMPKWSKSRDDGNNQPTDPKLQKEIKKRLSKFNRYDKKHKF